MCPGRHSQRKPQRLNLCRHRQLLPRLICLIKQSKSLTLILLMALNCFSHCEMSHTMHLQCKQFSFSSLRALWPDFSGKLGRCCWGTDVCGDSPELLELFCFLLWVTKMCFYFIAPAVPRDPLLWVLHTLTWRHLFFWKGERMTWRGSGATSGLETSSESICLFPKQGPLGCLMENVGSCHLFIYFSLC